MSDSVLAYQHSLPPTHYEQLCALPEVIARYSKGSNGTALLQQIREECTGLPVDPDRDSNRLLELEANDHAAWIRMLEWAAHRSGDERFALLARDLQEGAAESDREMARNSLLN